MNQWEETNSKMKEIQSVKWSRFYGQLFPSWPPKKLTFLFEEISMSCLYSNESVERDKLRNERNLQLVKWSRFYGLLRYFQQGHPSIVFSLSLIFLFIMYKCDMFILE